MATFAPSSSPLSSTFLQNNTKPFKTHFPNLNLQQLKARFVPFKFSQNSNPRRLNAVAAEVSTAEPSSEAARRLYVGNIPRTVTNDELRKIVEEHGAVEKAEVMYDKYSGRSRRFAFVTMKTVEDASASVEKLNGTEVGGRAIKVNITEKPLASLDASLLQVEESQYIDSPHKVWEIWQRRDYRNTEDLFLGEGKSSQCKGIPSSRDLKIQWIRLRHLLFRRGCGNCHVVSK